jgi:hypothetical protein
MQELQNEYVIGSIMIDFFSEVLELAGGGHLIQRPLCAVALRPSQIAALLGEFLG